MKNIIVKACFNPLYGGSRIKKRFLVFGGILIFLGLICISILPVVRFFIMMERIAPWPEYVARGDGYSLHPTTDTACFLLHHSETKRHRIVHLYYYFTAFRGNSDAEAKLFLLMRVLFDVPKAQPQESAAVFAAWLGEGSPYPYEGSDTVNLLWPLEYRDEQLALRSMNHIAYIGPPYNGLAEYNFFVSNFPFRTIKDLKCE